MDFAIALLPALVVVSAEEDTNILFYSLVVTTVLTTVIVLICYSFLQLRKHRIHKLHRQFKRLEGILRENERRLQLLEGHAVEYMNSLGDNARRSYLLAKEMVIALSELVSRLDTDLRLQDLGSIVEAQELLSERILLRSNAFTGVSNIMQHLPAMTADQLEQKFDELFEVVGNDISNASDRAYFEFGTKRGARRLTLEHIADAGVRLARRAGRRITSGFRSPFAR